MILALDLSTARTGFAIISYEGKLIESGNIVPPNKLTTSQKIYYVVQELKPLYNKVKEVVLENTYSGINATTTKVLNWLGGAVIYSCIEKFGEEPKLIAAVSARSLIEINPKASKAELQLWTLEHFFKKIDLKEFVQDKKKLTSQYVNKKMTKKQVSKLINGLTKRIEEKTGLTNDASDAIILGYARYLEIKKT